MLFLSPGSSWSRSGPESTWPQHHFGARLQPGFRVPFHRVRYVAVLGAAAALSAGSAAAAPDPAPYAGLGTWIDVYDPHAWSAPAATAAAIRARGVRTI